MTTFYYTVHQYENSKTIRDVLLYIVEKDEVELLMTTTMQSVHVIKNELLKIIKEDETFKVYDTTDVKLIQL